MAKLHPMHARAVSLLATAMICGACGGSDVKEDAPLPQADAEEVPEVAPPEPPRFVVVHRNTQIHLAPRDDAPYLQYRDPERQVEFDERLAEREAKRLEREKEDQEKFREREKKRRDKLRKSRRKYSSKKRRELAERDKERAENLRNSRAARELRDARARARKDRIEASDRWWVPFEILSSKSGWLELRPVPRGAEPPQCFGSNFGDLDRLDATFWIREEDASDVVSKRVRVPVYAGTEVILTPGVALREVEGSEPSRYVAYVDGFELELEVPPDAVDRSYRPGRPFEAPLTDTVFTDIAFAKERLKLGKSTPFPYNPYRALHVTGTLRVDSRFYVTTQTPCGEYTVRASEDLVEPVGRRGAQRFTADSTSVAAPFARTGAIAHLPDGNRFGRVLTNFPLGNPTGTHSGRECWRTAVWGETDAVVQRAVELCFEATDIERPETGQ